MSFKVKNGGIFSTIQDQGRYGLMHQGRTPSGVMDEYAYLWGQKLLNQKNMNAIEVMVGLKLEALESMSIAITGADLSFKINGTSLPIWQTYYLKQGDTISFEKQIAGQRAYVAVKGGFRVAKVHGSCSTTIKEKIGAKLKYGDILQSKKLPKENSAIWRVKKRYIPNYFKNLTLRILLGYQERYFCDEVKEKFFSSEYEITLQSDRMGFKLKGEPITPTKGGIISEGIAFGSVQVPANGQPIVLLKERQTIGGYPKIGTVLPVDCFALAQLPIGSKVHFEPITIDEVEKIMYNFYFNL